MLAPIKKKTIHVDGLGQILNVFFSPHRDSAGDCVFLQFSTGSQHFVSVESLSLVHYRLYL